MVEKALAALGRDIGLVVDFLKAAGMSLLSEAVQSQAGIGDGLGKIALVAFSVKREKGFEMGQLAKVVGQQLIEKEQIGFELFGLGLALRGGGGRQAQRPDPIGRRKLMLEGII